MLNVMNNGTLYVFTDAGKCYQVKASAIPVGKYADKGVPIDTLSAYTTAENIIAIHSDINEKAKFLLVTANGMTKLTALSEFVSSRKVIDATKLVNDTLVAVLNVTNETVVLVTKQNMAVGFAADGVPHMKRNAVGVIGMKLTDNDTVTAAIIAEDNKFTFNDKVYNVSIVGKRGTRGKTIGGA
jgi:DNA gyrase subunit A